MYFAKSTPHPLLPASPRVQSVSDTDSHLSPCFSRSSAQCSRSFPRVGNFRQKRVECTYLKNTNSVHVYGTSNVSKTSNVSNVSTVGMCGPCVLHHGISKFNGSHFGLPLSSIQRMTGLGWQFRVNYDVVTQGSFRMYTELLFSTYYKILTNDFTKDDFENNGESPNRSALRKQSF